MKTLTGFLLAVLLIACSEGTDSSSRHDSIENTKDSLRAEADRSDAFKKCCFQSENDFVPFFPDTCGSFYKQSSKAELLCNADTLAHNTALVTYSDQKGHLLNVRLTEYCAFPGGLVADWEMKFQMHAHLSEFNEFDSKKQYHGFSCYDAKKSEAYLLVVADDRFLVEITDQVCENNKKVLEIYEHLPLNKLVEFGR